MSFLHLTLLDVSCMTPELVSFVSQCCAQDTAQTTMGILTLDQHCQVPRTGGNGSEEYGHSWLVDPKLITPNIWYLLLSSNILETYSEPAAAVKPKVDLP